MGQRSVAFHDIIDRSFIDEKHCLPQIGVPGNLICVFSLFDFKILCLIKLPGSHSFLLL